MQQLTTMHNPDKLGLCFSYALSCLRNNHEAMQAQIDKRAQSISFAYAAKHFDFHTEVVFAGYQMPPFNDFLRQLQIMYFESGAKDGQFLCFGLQTQAKGCPHFVMLLLNETHLYAIDSLRGFSEMSLSCAPSMLFHKAICYDSGTRLAIQVDADTMLPIRHPAQSLQHLPLNKNK